MQSSTITAPAGFEGYIRDEAIHAPDTARQHPGLDVSLVASVAGHPEARSPIVVARVGGGEGDVCLSIYVDGDLAETWTPGSFIGHFEGQRIPPGRHVVTARAVDTTGRWGGASIVVEIVDRPSR